MALTAKVWRTTVFIYNFIKPQLAIYLHYRTLQWQLLEFVSLPLYPVYVINRKSIILFGFPIYLWLPLVWEKYVQKYEEFSLYVYRYALTLPSWTLDQIEHMIYLSFYIFILKYSFLSLATFNKLYGFFFLWKREALFVHHFLFYELFK